MRFSIRTISIFILVAGSCGLLLAQSPTRPVKKSSVSGKVTIKGKGVPAIAVALRVSDFTNMTVDSSYKGITDEDGVFHINDVTPGTYQLSPLAPAFVSVGEPNRAKILVIGEGETVDGADISLVRGGVITGKVTDADGRPVIEMRVNLLPADRPTGAVNPRTPPLTNTTTDDRGIYRIYGLAAGRYKVSIGQSQSSSFMMNYSGRPWPVARAPNEVDALTLTKIYRPDQVDARARLRREAEAAKKEIELKPCENKTGFELTFYSAKP